MCQEGGRGETRSAIFPNSSNILSEKSFNTKFTLLRQHFVINFMFYEALFIQRIVKQNEEGNYTWKNTPVRVDICYDFNEKHFL